MTLPSVFFSRYNLCQVIQSFFLQGKTRLPIKVKLYAKLKKRRNPHSQAPGKVFEISKATRIIPFTKHRAPSTEHQHHAPSTSTEHQASSIKHNKHQAQSDTRHGARDTGHAASASAERRRHATRGTRPVPSVERRMPYADMPYAERSGL